MSSSLVDPQLDEMIGDLPSIRVGKTSSGKLLEQPASSSETDYDIPIADADEFCEEEGTEPRKGNGDKAGQGSEIKSGWDSPSLNKATHLRYSSNTDTFKLSLSDNEDQNEAPNNLDQSINNTSDDDDQPTDPFISQPPTQKALHNTSHQQ
jgi:hypothetical protein